MNKASYAVRDKYDDYYEFTISDQDGRMVSWGYHKDREAAERMARKEVKRMNKKLETTT